MRVQRAGVGGQAGQPRSRSRGGLGAALRRRGAHRQEPLGPCASLADSIQDGNSLFDFSSFSFFGYRLCLFLYPHHKSSNRTLGAELKIMPESKQLPSSGTRLKLAWFVHVFCRTHEEPSLTGSGAPRSPPPVPRRVGVSLLVSTPFCSSVSRFTFLLNEPFPILIRASTAADAEPQRDLLEDSRNQVAQLGVVVRWTQSLRRREHQGRG